jgi:pimeloyl-ACP methyl ester carboxylesterase
MTRATEIIFLPGFDGMAELRRPFLDALGRRFPVRGVTYPNRPLSTLNGYTRFAAGEAGAEARPVLVAESFSGLVAARWSVRDPHVAGVVLCAAFTRNPASWLASLGASMPSVVQLGANLFEPVALAYRDPVRRRWAAQLSGALRALHPAVLAERMRIIAEEDVRKELGALGIPLVLMQFERDQVIGAHARTELEKACPACDVVRVDAPHFALETLPEQCAEALSGPLGRLF